ncbi:MAG: DNA mismatch repair endonuclease MutL [Thermoplasmata archaeon]|nr:DNA mismatch repair endonuclease MutL [Thermoplasmata archaeon]
MSPAERGAPIRRLSPEVVHRIAAGEVVERPASVVKELVENALDAGATEVTVALRGGGLEEVEVRDDGAGIRPEELPLAVERYATSKLADAAGLDAIDTLGFRGEALAAIAAVSHLTIVSRVAGEDAAATISVDGGTVGPPGPAGRGVGTTVTVRDLFFNVPARRKFLRGAAAEQLAVGDVVDRMYLARPDVLFTVSAEGRTVRQYPRATGPVDAAARVLGEELLDHAVEVADGPSDGLAVAGVVGRPSLHRGTSHGIYLAVNGRVVESKTLAQAVRLAYRDYLPPARFPVAVLHLTLDPLRVDVNVHPTKREVRIARERDVAERLRVAVRRAIREGSHAVDRDVPDPVSTSPAPPVFEPVEDDRPVAGLSLAAMPASRQHTLVAPEPPRSVPGTSRHPSIRLLGPVFDLYWLGESDGALVLVDQHAASERVVFEALRSGDGLARQELVEPITLRLTARRAEALAAHAGPVDAAGFSVEPFGGDAWRLRSVPSYRGRRARPNAIFELLDELADGARPTLPDGLEERVAASIACHSAVRAGDVIEPAEMGRILSALFALGDAAFACPHGRPVVVQVPRSRLDRWFLRPGG